MKIGKYLRWMRTSRSLPKKAVAERLCISLEEYEEIEAGMSAGEVWWSRLLQIGIRLEQPLAYLITETGKYEDRQEGLAGTLIARAREKGGLTRAELAGATGMSLDDYEKLEKGESELERYGPMLLALAQHYETYVVSLVTVRIGNQGFEPVTDLPEDTFLG